MTPPGARWYPCRLGQSAFWMLQSAWLCISCICNEIVCSSLLDQSCNKICLAEAPGNAAVALKTWHVRNRQDACSEEAASVGSAYMQHLLMSPDLASVPASNPGIVAGQPNPALLTGSVTVHALLTCGCQLSHTDRHAQTHCHGTQLSTNMTQSEHIWDENPISLTTDCVAGLWVKLSLKLS